MSRISSDKPRDKWDLNVVAVVVLFMVSYSIVSYMILCVGYWD